MKGSVMDGMFTGNLQLLVIRGLSLFYRLLVLKAMSEAVEGAELMLYGLSEKYKEM